SILIALELGVALLELHTINGLLKILAGHRFVIRVGVERGLKFLERFTLQLRLQSLGLSDLLGDCPFGLLLGLGLSDWLLVLGLSNYCRSLLSLSALLDF